MLSCVIRVVLLYAAVLNSTGCLRPDADPCESSIEWGRDRLLASLRNSGDSTAVALELRVDPSEIQGSEEGFRVSVQDRRIVITGGSPAGAMYGALSLADTICAAGYLPERLTYSDRPRLKLRGTCILLMKLGRYNFPITPEEFPFFYDRGMWIEYLDFLAHQRFNYIALWNGHPFAYFVKLDRYPEAQAGMDPALLLQNREMLAWLTREGAKRNIRFMFEFYNIHTSVYYQKEHALPDEISAPTPELEEYTAYAIERFVREFPNVGLYITPGEALEPAYAPYWLNEVLFPAVLRSGKTPPVMVRAWGIGLEQGMAIAGNYPELYFERKFNVEMIADTRIDPENRAWADLTGNYTVNIHCVANLEPFRWNPPGYIRQIMQNSVAIGANGIHLYPRKAWRWPYGCEIGNDQRQWERDELWFRMWGRYAWDPERASEPETRYWIKVLAGRYGSEEAARLVLSAFQTGADILPALQRLMWIGNDNHTVVTAGVRLADFKSANGIPFLPLEPVEKIPDYFERIAQNLPGDGTDPVRFLAQKLTEAGAVCAYVSEARRWSQKNDAELERLAVDAEAIQLTVKFYLEKLQAAAVLFGNHERLADRDLQKGFLQKLRSSVTTFRALSELTKPYYESISDVPAWTPDRLKTVPYHWKDILPIYEKEYQVYADEFKDASGTDYYRADLPGLTGIWYGDPGLKNIKGPDPVSTLHMDWSGQEKQRESRWSAEWFGAIQAAVSGPVHFYVRTGQEVLLEIAGHPVLKVPADAGSAELTVNMEKGQKYPIRVVYNHFGGDSAYMEINQKFDGGRFTPVASEYLWHAPADQAVMERILKLRAVSGQ